MNVIFICCVFWIFNEWDVTALNPGTGAVCESMPPRLNSSSCTADKVGAPRLATGGMLQRIWMLGSVPRMANEWSLFCMGREWGGAMPLVDLLFCANVCCVRTKLWWFLQLLTKRSHSLLVGPELSLFVFVAHRCGSQWNKLVDRGCDSLF